MPINEIWLKSFFNTDVGNLGDMAGKVALQNFEFRYVTLLIFNSTLYYSVEVFLHVFNYNIIINEGIVNPRLAKNIPQYVLFGSDIMDLELLLDTLRNLEFKNTGKFIVVCQSHVLSECDEKEMINLFWAHKIVDVVLIKYSEEQAHGYTYYPILGDKCFNVDPIKLISYSLTKHGKIFGGKLKKLNFCPLFVSTFIQIPYMNIINGVPIGADGDLLRVIAYGLNTSLEMRTPNRGYGWGSRYTNGTWAGSLADIYEDLANISMTSAALTLTRFSDFQLSRSYYVSSVVWIAHPAALQNEALKLLHPFASSTQIALAISFILVILCAFIVKSDAWSSIFPEPQNLQSSKSVVFYSWMICMGQAIIRLPTKSALLHITLLWIYYCFLIRTAYQVYLISSLKGTFYEDQFETIDDAIRANYEYGGGAALRDYYIDYPVVYSRWTNVDPSEIIATALNISTGKKFVLAMNKDTAMMLIKTRRVKLHILPQALVITPSVIFFKKYSPLEDSINVVLSRIVASGLPEKFHKDYTSVKSAGAAENIQDTLKLSHFIACYVVLLIGWILSFVFFSLEFYFGKIYKHPMFSP